MSKLNSDRCMEYIAASDAAASRMDSTTEQLEAMIDKHGLLHVLCGLELICMEKAEHIRHNWQDRGLAKEWDKASTQCKRAASEVTRLSI